MISGRANIKTIEFNLLLAGAAYALAGGFLVFLLLPGKPGWQMLLAVFVSAFAFFTVHWIWQKRGFCPDPFILPVLFVLTATGICFLFRLNEFYGVRQLVWLIAGVGALIAITVFNQINTLFVKFKYFLAAAGAIVLILPVFLGIEVGGARSWLDFKIFYLQPSEFVKIILILFLAAYFAENRRLLVPDTSEIPVRLLSLARHWGPLLGMLAVSLIILVFQKDLGMALVYFMAFLALVYVATDKLAYVLGGLGLFLLGSMVAYFSYWHVHTRVEIWMNPWQDNLITGSAYQVIQSLLAINAGGVFGSGLGAGSPEFIPAVHTDFIFSAICEEMGLLGGGGLILLYMVLIFRGICIALNARDDFSVLLATGLTVILGIQVFIIIAGVIKLLPLTGITLPFISYGGSSLVANFILMGLLLNVSHCSGGFR